MVKSSICEVILKKPNYDMNLLKDGQLVMSKYPLSASPKSDFFAIFIRKNLAKILRHIQALGCDQSILKTWNRKMQLIDIVPCPRCPWDTQLGPGPDWLPLSALVIGSMQCQNREKVSFNQSGHPTLLIIWIYSSRANQPLFRIVIVVLSFRVL